MTAATANGIQSFAAAPRPHDAGERAEIRGRRADVDAYLIEAVGAPRCERAFQRHVRGDREKRDDDERLQVAGADADQRLAAAARGDRHAEAEHEAADQVREPGHLRAGVDRLREVDVARRLQRGRAGDRDGDGEQPHAHAPPVAEVHHVGDRAHRAEAHAVRDRAEDEREHERGGGDERCELSGIFHTETA